MTLRRMIHPYRLTDQLALYPYKYNWHNNWLFQSTAIAILLTIPIMYKIQKLSYSPVNVERWEKTKAKDEREYQDHLLHLK